MLTDHLPDISIAKHSNRTIKFAIYIIEHILIAEVLVVRIHNLLALYIVTIATVVCSITVWGLITQSIE